MIYKKSKKQKEIISCESCWKSIEKNWSRKQCIRCTNERDKENRKRALDRKKLDDKYKEAIDKWV